MVASAIVHHDHVAALNHSLAGLRMGVGAIGAGSNDRVEGERVGTVGEHPTLQLGTHLLLGEAGLDVAADVLERRIGDRLRVAHELDLLRILHDAQVGNVAMEARHEDGHGGLGALLAQRVKERQVAGVLDGNDARAGLADALRRPPRGGDDVHVELPGGVRAKAVLEGAKVARVGVEPETVGGHEGGVGDLVVKGTLGSGEPAKVGVVAKDYRVIAPLGHKRAEPLDACGAGVCICHVSLFSLVMWTVFTDSTARWQASGACGAGYLAEHHAAVCSASWSSSMAARRTRPSERGSSSMNLFERRKRSALSAAAMAAGSTEHST